jgi:hypothetical protein
MNNNTNEKIKFIYNSYSNTNFNTNNDSTYQIIPSMTNKDKVSLQLNDDFNPNNFNLNYTNKKNVDKNMHFYYSNKDIGAGRGIGNVNISNDMRNGFPSRCDTKEFKQLKEEEQYFDFKFNTENNNTLDIDFSLQRCGDSTRRLHKISDNELNKSPNYNLVNNLSIDDNYYNNQNNKFSFNY